MAGHEHEIDKKPREALVTDLVHKQRLLKERTGAIREEHKSEHAVSDRKDPSTGRNERYWDIVAKTAERLITHGLEGFNSWEIGMMTLVRAAMDLTDALVMDGIKWGNLLPFKETRAGISQVAGFIIDAVIYRPAVKNEHLPRIQFSVDLSDGIGINVFKDGVSLVNDINNPDALGTKMVSAFDEALIGWAKLQGYRPSGGKLINKDSHVMTNEDFRTLNDNPDNSFQKFLSKRFEFDVSQSPSQSLSP